MPCCEVDDTLCDQVVDTREVNTIFIKGISTVGKRSQTKPVKQAKQGSMFNTLCSIQDSPQTFVDECLQLAVRWLNVFEPYNRTLFIYWN